jgi:hypothetical protein
MMNWFFDAFAGFRHFGVRERLIEDADGHVCYAGDAEDADVHVAGGDDFEKYFLSSGAA